MIWRTDHAVDRCSDIPERVTYLVSGDIQYCPPDDIQN
jgi:hypothetical protein